jgi:phosphoglycolate phosphatase-like HAD superfamily hydrolase
MRVPLALGPAPIVDFDGTIARLDVDWARLRMRLRVDAIGELWARAGDGRWAEVTAAEVAAAEHAREIACTTEALRSVRAFAVVTDNSEHAIDAYLRRLPELASRVAYVGGRESLEGPKRDAARFRKVFDRAVAATGPFRSASDPIVYVGDQQYELALASALGARTVCVVDGSSIVDVTTPPTGQPPLAHSPQP